jgi:hypothetical protein
MNDKKPFFQNNKVGPVLCVALLGTLTGCVGYVDGPRGVSMNVVQASPSVKE